MLNAIVWAPRPSRPAAMFLACFFFFFFFLLSTVAHAADDPEISPVYQEFLNHLLEGADQEAAVAAKTMVDQAVATHGPDSVLLAVPYTYLGMTQVANHAATDALSSFASAIELIEEDAGPFAVELIRPLKGVAMARIALADYDGAEDTLRRAQNIIHRSGGVYSADQLSILEWLIRIHGDQRQMVEADREELLYLKVHEEVFGPADLRTVPALQRVAEYMAGRGMDFQYGRRPPRIRRNDYFKFALELYDRAIEIVELEYGVESDQLIEPLRAIARVRFAYGFGRLSTAAGPFKFHDPELKFATGFGREEAARAMARVVDILKVQPETDTPDLVRATVDLADLYTLWNDPRATATYREAWLLMGSDEVYAGLRHELFGVPVRLLPASMAVRFPNPYNGDKDHLYVELEYKVSENGRAGRVEIVDSNVPQHQTWTLRRKLYSARFRPRMNDGEVVTTEGMRIREAHAID